MATDKIPVRILLQIREGKNPNVIIEGSVRFKNSKRNDKGVMEHDIAMEDVAELLEAALDDVRKRTAAAIADGPYDTGRAWQQTK